MIRPSKDAGIKISTASPIMIETVTYLIMKRTTVLQRMIQSGATLFLLLTLSYRHAHVELQLICEIHQRYQVYERRIRVEFYQLAQQTIPTLQ